MIQILADYKRHDVANLLDGQANVGVELGVAEGVFSERMMASGKFAHFIGVDMYADSHDVRQYKRALARMGLHSNYKLLRMRFDEAIELFDDASLDFIYFDGYAHGGEEGGETLFEWYRKVKVGGLLAGDDYHADWPLVVKAVDTFAAQLGEQLLLTGITETDNPYCRYPTWAMRKTKTVALKPPEALIREGKRANARVALQQEGGLIKSTLRKALPAPVIAQLKKLRGGGAVR